ncbi:MAG: hypothetical protein FJ225_07210 [Lentisphaerae bacterium]|nr:hypothetical protein [Lentisphaerota bacterium]
MIPRLLIAILRNLARSRTRLMITVLGCTAAAFVTCFFLAAQMSLARMTQAAGEDANVIVRQTDRY